MTFVSLCLLMFLLNFTAPSSAGPFGILIVFFLIYLSSLGLVTIILFGANKALRYSVAILDNFIKIKKMTLLRASYYASIIATAPVMVLALLSVGVSGWYSYLLVVIFVATGCLYMSRKIV